MPRGQIIGIKMSTTCPCGTLVMMSDAIDEQGEFYRCQHCGWPFQY